MRVKSVPTEGSIPRDGRDCHYSGPVGMVPDRGQSSGSSIIGKSSWWTLVFNYQDTKGSSRVSKLFINDSGIDTVHDMIYE